MKWKVAAAGLTLLVAAGGCRHIEDVSAAAPYAGMIGATYRLCPEAELLREGGPGRGYDIVIHRYHGHSDKWVVATLPEGWPIRVEAVKRETGRTLLGDLPFDERWAIVSLDDPRTPSRRIRATLALADFDELKKAGD
jgi:hypothetical protein